MRFLIVLALLLPGMAAQAMPILTLTPSSTTLGINEAFTLNVTVDNVDALDELIAFGFDVGTTGGIALNLATVGPSFFDDSAAFATTDVAGSAFPPVSGDGILLAIFDLTTGVTEGVFDISLFTTAGDFGVSEGLFTLQNTFDIRASTSVTVQRAAVPVPSSLLLIMLALAVYRQRADVSAPRQL